ncbi:tRNA pseudouridine(38-40) synthase TruA [Paenibacillus koleovorans]|uniref:tRNA pseudouridine(38-40) synthase TruA n=1 Tax=Paenibacillus koleovorans TaxID=121608 RepID=UPI000FD7CF55|nr:tRNA pseudouridine(38-40) synthase TruA [Paenibacillus koleovorans]
MRNIRMVISYEGTRYFGFQSQPGGNTIQDELEKAVKLLTGEAVSIISTGRTDAGVHARCHAINFRTESQIPIHRWALALNSRLPDDIVVQEAEEVPLSFHARRSAKRKTYRYTIDCGRYHDVFNRHLQFHHPTPLNREAMAKAMECLIGEHDFTSFCSTKSTKPSHVRILYEAYLEYNEQEARLQLYFTGNGFLQHMVRILVGTLIQIGEGKRSSEDMRRILEARDRSQAGPTAMSHGLMLWEVFYAQAQK